ncbi:MAG: hypothetical protein VXV91_02325, partial [Verrucomicrobiota bacterium]|nr:hypothetical protein [Verrucomicrobiota bacterium]
KSTKFMNKSSFFIAGQHAVIEALRNPNRKVLRVFLTEDAKKNIEALRDVSTAQVDIVWDPPWTPHMISDAGRQKLGLE